MEFKKTGRYAVVEEFVAEVESVEEDAELSCNWTAIHVADNLQQNWLDLCCCYEVVAEM